MNLFGIGKYNYGTRFMYLFEKLTSQISQCWKLEITEFFCHLYFT